MKIIYKHYEYNSETGLIKNKATNKILESIDGRGYRDMRIDNKGIKQHRFIWFMTYSYWPEYIDHINGDRSDNRISNLREVTKRENALNKRLLRNNTSGVNGVWFNNSVNKWQADIKINSKKIYLGVFNNIEDAIIARKSAEYEYGFHENHGRKL